MAITGENRATLEEYWRKLPNVDTTQGFKNWLLSDSYDNTYQHWGTGDSYTEITFEQFQTHILKQNNMKKIIGYKLSGVATTQEVARLLDCDDDIDSNGLFFNARQAASSTGQRARDLKVFDIWFIPVYEDDIITIGSYVAKKDGFNVSVGCQNYNKEQLEVIQGLLKREVKHEVKVDGINITLEHINKLLALLNI